MAKRGIAPSSIDNSNNLDQVQIRFFLQLELIFLIEKVYSNKLSNWQNANGKIIYLDPYPSSNLNNIKSFVN